MNFKEYSKKGLYLLTLLCLAGAGCSKKEKIEETKNNEPMVLIIETNEEFIASQEAEVLAMVNNTFIESNTEDATTIDPSADTAANYCDDLLPICEK